MKKINAHKIALLSAAVLSLPLLAQAEPTALLEKSASYAVDNTFKAYSVPTKDANGKIKYYDVTVTLGVNNDGTVSPIADVVSKVSPSITTKKLVPGSYKSTSGDIICTVTNMTLTNGRIQSNLSCTRTTSSQNFTLSAATGGISSGHPFLSELVKYGVSKRTDVATQTWGVMTNSFFTIGSCSSGSYSATTPIGAKTDGKNLILSVYSRTETSSFLCSATLVKQ